METTKKQITTDPPALILSERQFLDLVFDIQRVEAALRVMNAATCGDDLEPEQFGDTAAILADRLKALTNRLDRMSFESTVPAARRKAG